MDMSMVQRLSIMDQVAFALEDSLHRIGDIPADLVHPQLIRGRCDGTTP
jgi:hypothetical protein